MAERFATQLGMSVLVIEKRDHIAGNMYDYRDENGILVHKYGPHLFRTSSDQVKDYISRFTDWHPYEHRVLANINDVLVPVPFNLTSLEKLLPEHHADLSQRLIGCFGMDRKVPVSALRRHEDERLRWLGEFIFENIYLNYTVKQWGDKPENLDFETITARVPVHISFDDRYFQETHQALPRDGYTAMFARMLDHPLITVRLNTDALSLLTPDQESKRILLDGTPFTGQIVYTGPLDELFGYCFGELPYRSLRFDLEAHDTDFYQPTGTVNYPNTERFTRITEFKHMMREKPARTTIMKEYPQEYDRTDPAKNAPYYPIPKDSSAELYARYAELAQGFENLTVLGRLAEYRYYDMNNIILHSLEVFDEKFRRT
jgi:UDP-galactopyranose mutase